MLGVISILVLINATLFIRGESDKFGVSFLWNLFRRRKVLFLVFIVIFGSDRTLTAM